MRRLMIWAIYILAQLISINRVSSQVTNAEYALMPPVFELDNFDQCMLLGKEALYCTIEFQITPTNPKNPSKVWTIIEKTKTNDKNYRHDNLRHGICVPLTCPNISSSSPIYDSLEFKNDLAECYNKKYLHMGLSGTVSKIHCQNSDPLPLDTYDISVGGFLVIYVIIVIIASLYEGVHRYRSKKLYDSIANTIYGKIIFSFSIPKNWERLKYVADTENVRALRFMQGIRFYNMIIVIMAHASMMVLLGPVANTRFAETMTEKVLAKFLASGSYAVQTFFIISGWLLTFHFLETFYKKKEVKISYLVWAYIHRYIRLTPPLAVLILINSTLIIHADKGPYWHSIVGQEHTFCRKNGWSNLLYINTYVDPTHMCFSESWYLATDAQFFIMQLTIIYFILKYPHKVWWILGGSLFTQNLLLAIIVYINNYPITIFPNAESTLWLTCMTHPLWIILVASSYSNASGAILGIIMGYIYFKYRHINCFTKTIYKVLWWILIFLLPIGIILIPASIIYSEDYQENLIFTALYIGCGRTIYGIGISILMWGFVQNFGWMAKWACEWSPTYVLGRLTYSAFLVHVPIALLKCGPIRSPIYVRDSILINEMIWLVATSYLIGLFMALLVELPVSELQKLIIPQVAKSEAQKIENQQKNDKKE